MTNAENSRLDRIESLLERLTIDVGELKEDVEGLEKEVRENNIKDEIYQKSSQQVVNLAFSLILAATAAIIIPAILSR